MNLNEAKSLAVGSTVYYVISTNVDGTPQRWKVTSVKTWKTMPERVEVGLESHGLWDLVSQDHLHLMLHKPSLKRYKEKLKVDDNYVYSYGKPVAKIDDENMCVVVDKYWSKSTSQHINYVADQFCYTVVKNY